MSRIRYIMSSTVLWENSMIPHISIDTVVNRFYKLRCFSCSSLLPLNISPLYLIRCEKCGQVHDCKPHGISRPPVFIVSPSGVCRVSSSDVSTKVISRMLPSGAVSRRRVPVSPADDQLDLFGGVL